MQCGGADQPCTVSKRIKQTNGMVKNRCAQNDTAAHRNKKRNQSDRSDVVSAETEKEENANRTSKSALSFSACILLRVVT